VKFCLKKVIPLSKAKYLFLTDSVQVPRGKIEKNPQKGSEKNLKLQTGKSSYNCIWLNLLQFKNRIVNTPVRPRIVVSITNTTV